MQGQNFVDRKLYQGILEKRVIALKDGYRQNIALIGEEQMGKTTIAFKFLNNFCDSRFIMVYMDCRPEPLVTFARRFIGVLLYNFLTSSNTPLKEELDFLINKAGAHIPETVARIRAILADLEKRKKENILNSLFSLTDLIHKETNKFCVVVLDEFHNLEHLGVKNVYKEWSKLLILQKTTMYVIISSQIFKTKNILSRDLCLLFGNFEVITVEPFDIKTTEEYLGSRLKSIGLDLAARNFIVHFTGGHPFYLDLICGELLKAERARLADILENLFFLSSGTLNQKFTNYLKRFEDTQFSRDYTSILYLISSGQNKVKDIAHILRKPKKEIDLRVNYLLETDAVSRSGDFLKINDRVLGFWLKFVYQEKLHSLTFDSVNQKILFRKNIDDMIGEFIKQANIPVSQRITELVRLFSDDRIQIERRKLTLNHFREIKPLEFRNKGLREGLICRSTDSQWIFGFKYDPLTEEDISEFSRECKKYRHKQQRKIIVTLRDIEQNSRLKALEEKIWTWDLNNINQLFDVFSKPRIIV
jgi:hypothetical protein